MDTSKIQGDNSSRLVPRTRILRKGRPMTAIDNAFEYSAVAYHINLIIVVIT